MIAGELSHLAGEPHAAIGEQDLSLADATGIKDDLTRRRIAGVVLVSDAEVAIAERDPHRLPAPAHVHHLALERHVLEECRTGLRRGFALEPRIEGVGASGDLQLTHQWNSLSRAGWLGRQDSNLGMAESKSAALQA